MTTTNPKNCQENDAELEQKKEYFPQVESVEPIVLSDDLNISTDLFLSGFGDVQCFRTFYDPEKKGAGKNFNGSHKSLAQELKEEITKKRGIFFIPNGGGHKDENITRIRSAYMDLDNKPIQPVLDVINRNRLTPYAIVQSSPGDHWHIYWLTRSDFPKAQFRVIQSAFIKPYGHDKTVINESRVMRLPGYPHQKKEPFLVKVVFFCFNAPRYSSQQIIDGLELNVESVKKEKQKKAFILPDIVEQGTGIGREPTMLSYIGKLWSEGFSKDEITTMAHAVNQERFKPPLEDRIVDERIERVTTKYQQGTHKVRGLGAGKRFYPADWIKALREKYHLLYHNKRFYYYENGYYKEVDEDARGVLIESLGGPELRQHNYKEIYYKLGIKLTADQEGREVDSPWILNLENGWFNLREEPYPFNTHSPKNLTTFKNFIKYSPESVCVEFDKFLARQFPDPKLRSLIWEMIGYLLIPSTKFQVGFFFKGPTETGKTTLLNIIIALLGGDDRCSHVALEKFGDRFSLSDIEGKLVNLDDETEFRKSWADKPVKQVISGVKITVENKNEKARIIRPTARLIVASNDFPHTADTTTAFFRRWIVIPAIVPRPDPPDRDLEERIIKNELEGILIKAMAGLARLLKNKKFTIPESCDELKNEWEEKVDLVQYWANRCLERRENHDEPWSGLVDQCNEFVHDEGLKAQFSRRAFNKRMANLGFEESIVHGYGYLKNYIAKKTQKTRNLQVAQL